MVDLAKKIVAFLANLRDKIKQDLVFLQMIDTTLEPHC